jgi:hypothetical protein
VEEAVTMAAAEAAEDNNDKRESDVATVTGAVNNSNSNCGSRGNDNNGGSG